MNGLAIDPPAQLLLSVGDIAVRRSNSDQPKFITLENRAVFVTFLFTVIFIVINANVLSELFSVITIQRAFGDRRFLRSESRILQNLPFCAQ